MRKWLAENKFVIIVFICWRVFLGLAEAAAPLFPTRSGYFGPSPWANFDGIHYLAIAGSGYFQYGEAFFPLYPMIIRFFNSFIPIHPALVGETISLICFLAGLLLFYNILKQTSLNLAKWTILFILAFPTSFFFTGVYPEGLFFFLSIASFYFAGRKQWVMSSLFVALAGATKVYGIILVIPLLGYFIQSEKVSLRKVLFLSIVPLGLLSYMAFLFVRTGDPLSFFHAQSAFGANRSSGGLILLPQVLWRYGRIIFTAFLQPTLASYIITLFELFSTLFGFFLLYLGWKKRMDFSLLLYAFFILVIPSLTGTLSSMPRYFLSAFPLFIILGMMDNTRIKVAIVGLFTILQFLAAMVFIRGWFIA